MNNLTQIQNEANKLINTTFKVKARLQTYEINLKKLGYTFTFDRAKRRAGKCNYSKKEISISKELMLANIHKTESIKDTLLHEIAHAISVHIYGVREGRGHGYTWQNVASQIGAKPQARYTKTKYPNEVESKYTLKCNSCGKESARHKKPKHSFSCGKCSPKKYNEKYKLEVIQNY